MTGIDWLILGIYFAFVLGVGAALRRFTRTSTDFFMAGRALPAWVCGLAFISANLGAQEVIGMAASGAKYGVATGHFYWIGHVYASEMAQNFWTAIMAWTACFVVTIGVSLATRARPPAELAGLVYSLTSRPAPEPLAWYARTGVLATVALVATAAINVWLW